MNKLIVAAIGGLAGGVVLSTQVAGPLIAQEDARNASVYQQLDLFGDVFERIRSNYVEEVDEAALIEAAINGMLTSLDPHSSYLPPRDFDSTCRCRPAANSAGSASRSRRKTASCGHHADGRHTRDGGRRRGGRFHHPCRWRGAAGPDAGQAVDLMRGPVGSEIVITVVREGRGRAVRHHHHPRPIRLTAVRSRLKGNTAILRISTFNDQTYPNLRDGLEEMIEEVGGLENLNGVVIDLRNNAGGLLSEAIACPTPSSNRARSSPPAGGSHRTATGSTPPRAT
jgi:carboxyl-terminal processing protease